MRQFCFSPSSIGCRCFSEEQVWLNGTRSIEFPDSCRVFPFFLSSFIFSFPPPPRRMKSLDDSVTLSLSLSFARLCSSSFLFCSGFSPPCSKDDHDLRASSPTIHQMDKFYWIMYLTWDSRHLCRDVCIRKKSGTLPTALIGNRFPLYKKKEAKR